MAAAVREGGNDRRASERAARKSDRGGEPSSAARKQRSRPPTYKGGAWKLVPKCVEHIHPFASLLMLRREWLARSDTARLGTREAQNAPEMVAIEHRSNIAEITRVLDLLCRPFVPFSSRTAATGGVFKNAAVHVLRHERRLMSTGEVTKCVRDRVRFLLPNAEMARNA